MLLVIIIISGVFMGGGEVFGFKSLSTNPSNRKKNHLLNHVFEVFFRSQLFLKHVLLIQNDGYYKYIAS